MFKTLSKFVLGSFASMGAYACQTATVKSFENRRKINDYVTTQDEITMRFGVGSVVAYQYSDIYTVNKKIDVPEGKIAFPCLNDEVFYFYLVEHDQLEDDIAIQVSLACADLQDGINTIQIHLSERSKALSSVYDALKDNTGTQFRFFDNAVVDQAQYVITLDVEDGCTKGAPLVNEDLKGLKGKLQYRQAPQATIDEKIEQDTFESEGGIVLEFG